MMKVLISVFVALVSALCMAQEMGMPPIPKEMDTVKNMVGTWNAEMTYYWMGQESKGKSVMVNKMSLAGRWIESDHSYEMPGMGTMSGKQLTTYNATTKKWTAYWFDQTEGHAMELTGDVVGNTMVLTSKPFDMGEMKGVSMRSTTKTNADGSIDFLLEMKQDGKWSPMMKGVYRKQK
jgi:hypothetical protein